MARELSHTGTLVNELPFAGIIHQLRREAPAVREIAESLIVLSTEHGFPQWLAFGKVLDSWAQAEQVDDVGLVAQLRGAIGNYRAQNELYLPYFLGLLAAIELIYEKADEGFATVSKALEMTERTGSRLMDPELYRLKGELLLLSRGPGPEPDAELAFRHAIEIARRQNTRSWELRASASLGSALKPSRETERSTTDARGSLWLVHRRLRHARSEGSEGFAGGVGGIRASLTIIVRAMSIFHKTDACRPWLCATTLPLLAFSCMSHGALLGRGAVRRPRPSMRAPRGISCCKPASARMQQPAIGGAVTIGIVACSC